MRVVVTGSTGRLGAALLQAIPGSAGLPRYQWDLDEPAMAEAALAPHNPEVVVHAAAMTDTEACARTPHLAWHRNGDATGYLARACRTLGARMVYVSTNEVFDGELRGRGYTIDDVPSPANAYGRSKAAGELFVARDAGDYAIVRTAWLFGGGRDFPGKILEAARRSSAPVAVTDREVGSPSYARDVATAIADLVADWRPGRHHLVNEGRATRVELAEEVLKLAGVNRPVLPVEARPRLSTPPVNAVLTATAAARHWRDALADYAASGGLLTAQDAVE